MSRNYRYRKFSYGRNKVDDGGFLDYCIHIFFVLLFAVVAAAVLITLFAPRGVDGASQIFGYELRIVESDSMQKHPDSDVSEYDIGSFNKNTMVVVELVPKDSQEAYAWYDSIEVGDVLTVRYTYNRQVTITHRVTDVEPNRDGTGFIIKLQGDNLNSNSGQLTQEINTSDLTSTDYVIGKVVWKSYPIGFVVGGLQRVFKAFAGE